MKIQVTGIDWDTDGETVDLPTEMVIDTVAAGIEDPAMEVADWLSDKYGWCVNGFKHGPAPDYTFDELEGLTEDDVMTMPDGTTMAGLPRNRYEAAYATLVAETDPDVQESFMAVEKLSDFDLYATVRVNGQAVPEPTAAADPLSEDIRP